MDVVGRHEEVVYHYPTTTMAHVYAVLNYYWDHRDKIGGAIVEEKAFVA